MVKEEEDPAGEKSITLADMKKTIPEGHIRAVLKANEALQEELQTIKKQMASTPPKTRCNQPAGGYRDNGNQIRKAQEGRIKSGGGFGVDVFRST